MKRTLCGFLGFTVSSLVSYGLVIGLSPPESAGPRGAFVAQPDEVVGHCFPPPAVSFQSDLVWNDCSLIDPDPRSTSHSVTGTRYNSSSGERAFFVRLEFGSQAAAELALARARGQAAKEEPYESGLGTGGRYIPHYHVQYAGDRARAYDSETEFATCEHAILWLEGEHLVGVYGPTYDTIRALYIWRRTQPN